MRQQTREGGEKMNQLRVLREKRANLWNETQKFLADHRGKNGLVLPEYLEIYNKMADEVKKLGEEIQRLDEQTRIDRKVDAPERKVVIDNPQEKEEETEFRMEYYQPTCKRCGFRPFVGYIPTFGWMKERGFRFCPGCGRKVKWDD